MCFNAMTTATTSKQPPNGLNKDDALANTKSNKQTHQ